LAQANKSSAPAAWAGGAFVITEELMNRPTLPAPMSDNDIFLLDICLSLRALVDLAQPPAPAPAPEPETVALREPAAQQPAPTKRAKTVTRDDLQAAARRLPDPEHGDTLTQPWAGEG
jgi:hypothetical protein